VNACSRQRLCLRRRYQDRGQRAAHATPGVDFATPEERAVHPCTRCTTRPSPGGGLMRTKYAYPRGSAGMHGCPLRVIDLHEISALILVQRRRWMTTPAMRGATDSPSEEEEKVCWSLMDRGVGDGQGSAGPLCEVQRFRLRGRRHSAAASAIVRFPAMRFTCHSHRTSATNRDRKARQQCRAGGHHDGISGVSFSEQPTVRTLPRWRNALPPLRYGIMMRP
jgi:hypothetical protein